MGGVMRRLLLVAWLILVVVSQAAHLSADTGHECWLRYAPIDDDAVHRQYASLPASVVSFGDSPVIASAREELIRGIRGMLGHTLRVEVRPSQESAFVLATLSDLTTHSPELNPSADLPPDAFWIKALDSRANPHLVITAANDRGVLYGVFALLRKIGLHLPVSNLDEHSQPYAPVRWVNEWDNLDGTIERGYGGRSIFFDANHVREDLSPVRDYARLLASLGINGCAVNNVNANIQAITPEFLPQLSRLAKVFRLWGVRVAVSIDFSSPRRLGGLETF